MTQEDKDLLLKDLCGRLPYGVKCKILETNEVRTLGTIQYDGENTLFDFWNDKKNRYEYLLYLSEFKPYLFPLSSMTEEQWKDYINIFYKYNSCWTIETFDWFNRNHIDYRGLIEKGLAIDATDLNIY